MSELDSTALTARELEVLRWAATGLPIKTIGAKVGCSKATTNDHLKNIHRKLGVHNRMQAVVKALRTGLLPMDRGE